MYIYIHLCCLFKISHLPNTTIAYLGSNPVLYSFMLFQIS